MRQGISGKRKTVIPVGVLYSLTGFYGVVGWEMLNGVLLAVDQVNADPALDFELRPVILDPGGSIPRYHDLCDTLIHQYGIRHIIGCYTSASRKQVLPLVEGAKALLWHSARYEGFESSENVIYVGAAPNQHVVPLARYALEHLDPRIYCVGSNYIWTWEINRVLREILPVGGGRVVGERMAPLGETALDYLVGDILEKRPGAVLNTLVGTSAYSFYKAWHLAGLRHPELRPDRMPMLSLSLCEAELPLIGAEAAAGHLVSSVYFQGIDRPENRAFLDGYRDRFGPHGAASVDTEAAFLCARLLAESIRRCGSAEVEAVRNAVYGITYEAPHGPVRVDPDNNHCFLTPRLARSAAGRPFEILWQASEPVKPDPYLAWLDLDELAVPRTVIEPVRPRLRLVDE
jgi:urea transport system substrate-binding protein